MERTATMETKEYWIDGYFGRWWSDKVWHCNDREIFVPKFATVSVTTVELHRIYVKESFALKQIAELERLKREKKLDLSDYKHILLKDFCEALNVPWTKPVYEAPFEVSL